MEFQLKKGYRPYEAYQYLEPGKDFKVIDWADWDWAGRNTLPLNPEEEIRCRELLERTPYVSLHDHPDFTTRDMSTCEPLFDAMRTGRDRCGYEALAYSNIDCIFDNMMDGTNIISSPNGWKWIDIIHDLGMRLCDLAHQDFIVHCKTVDDIFAAKKAGKIAMVFVIEGAAPIENEVDRIDILYGLGVRQLGVTYSESNALGSGCKEDHDGGLTMFGKQCVERMNKVGMLIDVSHCGSQTAYDAVVHSTKPIIMSHTGAKGVWNTKRLASDELIQAIAAKGGVVGMYGDHVGLHHAFAAALSTGDTSKTTVPYQEVPFVKYLENPTEASWNIPRWLIKHGYTDEEILKVLGGNAIRVLREVWS